MKRLFRWVTLGLWLLVAAQAWATVCTWSAASPALWSDQLQWSNGEEPTANDTVVFDGSGIGGCTIDAAAVCKKLTIGNAVDNITMLGAGTLTVGSDGFAMTDGIFTDGACVVTVGGTIRIVAPANLASTGLWMMNGTGNIENATASNKFNALIISGTGSIVATRTGDVYVEKLTIGDADTINGAFVTYLQPASDNFLTDDGGTSTGGCTDIYLASTLTLSAGAVSLGESMYVHAAAVADTLELAANLTVTDLALDTVTFNDGGDTVHVVDGGFVVVESPGDFSYVGLSSTGVLRQSGNGTCSWAYQLSSFPVAEYLITDGTAAVSKVTCDDSTRVICKKLTIGQNDTLYLGAPVDAGQRISFLFLHPIDTFVSIASGGTIVGDTSFVVVQCSSVIAQSALVVDAPLSLRGDVVAASVMATGAWSTNGNFCFSTDQDTSRDSTFVFDANDNILTVGETLNPSWPTSSTFDTAVGPTVKMGAATHVIGAIYSEVPGAHYQVPMMDWENCKVRTNLLKLQGLAESQSAGARILLSEGTAPSAYLAIANLPAIVCTTATAKPVVSGGSGNCSTFVVSAVCVDTVFFDTTETDDTIKVLSQFLANGTRGSTILYGNPGGTRIDFPDKATASDCEVDNLVAVDNKLVAIGCSSSGGSSGVQFRR